MRADRSLIAVALGVSALIVVAVVVVLVAGDRPAVALPADTPEGALQRYLQAWEDDDLEAAHGFFSTDVRARMSVSDLERMRDERAQFEDESSRRVIFDRTVSADGAARVQLTVESFSADGLSGSTYRSSYEVRMVREGSAWHIDEPLVWLDPAPVPFP